MDAQIALRQSKNDSAQLAYNLQQQRAEAEALKKDKASLLSDKANLAADIAALEARKKQLQQSLDAASADASNKGKALAEREQQIAEQQRKLQQLQSLIEEQKRASDALRNKMADALKGFAASDLTVTQKNGKVYVSLSEKLLFPSGSATVNMQGKAALQKLAEVLNANTDIAVNIEGHT
ncbi:MAG TPA: flagellar motor protein MotB, partial [Chitinophagaceae bacterium]|nr:flagellar motor protein MotB [Chitinophagaceae bacterium]